VPHGVLRRGGFGRGARRDGRAERGASGDASEPGARRGPGCASCAAVLCTRALTLDPKNDRAYAGLNIAYGALATTYGEMGKRRLSDYYSGKATDLRLHAYPRTTIDNFHRLKEILDRRRIRLVCVQYPMRDLAPLRRMFQGEDEGIVFVDNERVFKTAVRRSSYWEYFTDMFGGDFGHCTDKGNRLLAENIADAVWKASIGD
jgi:hypothetical protein